MISLSFDTDHMNEARMEEFLADLVLPGGATFFCTQPYCCLKREEFEVAPHPFLSGEQDWLNELKEKRAQFPKAMGWRSHSCVFSHTLAEWLSHNGYVYVSTHDSFGMKGIQPIRHLWGIWHLPIYYMDNLDFSRKRFWPERAEQPFARSLIDIACEQEGFYVFDFHPIHLLLNTPDPDWYMTKRGQFLAGGKIASLRHTGYGARSFFDDLITAMRKIEKKSISLIEGLQNFVGEKLTLRDNNSLRYLFDETRLGL